MTIANPNPRTRFPAAVQALLAEPSARYVLMDIGARAGVSPYWAPLAPLADFIGFEPDVEECAALNANFAREGRTASRIYPTAIGGRTGKAPFYVTQFSFSAGLLRGREEWLDRFPFTTLKVAKEIEVDVETLDHFCAQNKIGHVDFIKIDVEGSEYDIIEGARDMFAAQRVLGVYTEFWWDPVIKGQRGFADIDTLLRERGMRFFDLELHRYSRSTLPVGQIQTHRDLSGQLHIRARVDERYGQAWTGDALYFRDPVGELKAGKLDPMWDRATLLRLCGLFDTFDYGDCAIEVLEAFRSSLLAGVDVDRLIDALVPESSGRVLPYDQYRATSIELRQSFNTQTYGLSDWVPPPTGYKRR